jgi:hypothetical protein
MALGCGLTSAATEEKITKNKLLVHQKHMKKKYYSYICKFPLQIMQEPQLSVLNNAASIDSPV